MLENKKRANPFKELALNRTRIQWRIWEKIQNITVISSSYGGGGGIQHIVQSIELTKFFHYILKNIPNYIPKNCRYRALMSNL